MGTRNVNGVQVETAGYPTVRGEHWVATEAEYDIGRPIGYGTDEQAAINDLLEQLEQ